MQVCKYARGHLVPEQRGRLIGKGPLPKEKLMKALGEVSSHCEIFILGFGLYMFYNHNFRMSLGSHRALEDFWMSSRTGDIAFRR